MTKTVTVGAEIDDSTKLQKLIDETGNEASIYDFETDSIEVNTPIKLYNFTEFSCNDCTFTLMDNAPVNPFGTHIPLLGSKYTNGTEGLIVHDATFDGNRDVQNKVPLWYGHDGNGPGVRYGQGYHDFIGLGSLKSVAYTNSKNCEFYKIHFKNTLGDFIRPEGGQNISCHDITGNRCGHDGINYSAVLGGEIYNIESTLSVGAGVRLRSCKDIKIHDCNLNNKLNLTYGPAIQIQNTARNWTSDNIQVSNCQMYGTYGPGIQIIDSVTGGGKVTVDHCLFVGCGAMPASVNRPNVGGIVADGHDLDIQYNTFDGCYGYGVCLGAYDVTTSIRGLEATIKNNIITKTRTALKAGTYSGTGIADLTGGRYKTTVGENCQYGNKRANHYKVTPATVINKDPLYIGSSDLRLQDESPCYFKALNTELGAYNGVEYHYTQWPALVVYKRSADDLKAFEETLRSSEYLTIEDKVSYLNVTKEN